MKALKMIGIILVLFLVIIGVGAYFVYSNLDALVKEVVETAGPKATNTTVTLGSVKLELAKGSGEFKGFVVGNPAGFKSSELFKFDRILLQVAPESLTNNVIVVKNVIVEGISVTAEQKGTTTNIQELLKTLSSGSSSDTNDTPADSSSSQKRFMVENLRFADGGLRLVTEKYGEKSIALPKLEVQNLGSRSKGLTVEELGKAILTPVLSHAKRQAQKAISQEAQNELKDAAKKKLESELENNKSLQDAKSKLKGLF